MGDVVGTMTLQLSRWNTSRSKEFTFNLQVLNDKAVIWNERVGAVLPTTPISGGRLRPRNRLTGWA